MQRHARRLKHFSHLRRVDNPTKMGIPKFFRYIAQRWPLSSQVVNDNIIPEFDNLYLDMNSIIHTCTHGNADNVGNLDDDKVFKDIGNYIEHLFAVISPHKVFFMAIDGVAPRAKMNQQRGRRFRSAKDAEDARRKAANEGISLDEDPFDSNCITPGTLFMAKLTVFLKYFISRKITEDSKWQNCKIILSGHEVPGEGEHKIMKFIRSVRSKDDYDPNTRHCLYGLDADLIMLGLSTHSPHFSLLREEVTFGRKAQFQSAELSEKRFNLLHLSLVREYLELELTDGEFSVKPDFERQLDDFILIMFFIGNDFLPELPMLMVNDGAIPVIFDTYKKYLQSSGNGYLSKNGEIDFVALKHWMEFLKSYQIKKFEEQSKIGNWFTDQIAQLTSKDGEIVLTLEQHEVFDYISKFMKRSIKKNDRESELEIIEEPKFVSLVAEQAGFTYEGGKLKLAEDAVPASEALRVLRIYSVAKVHDPNAANEYGRNFVEWKNKYYMRKFGDTLESEKIQQASKRYLEGLQWVLFYYYRNCPSWSWYYDDHYAPMTTEIISAIGDGFVPEFNEGEPFRPFEQLMSVLPDRSVKLLPPALHHLVLEESSPIKDFYPTDFALDQNGKKASWEAVVLIPFIDQDRLLKYVRPIEDNGLTDAEKIRNSRGQEIEFYYDPNQLTFYQSPSPAMPPIEACSSVSRPLIFPSDLKIKYGLLEGSLVGTDTLAGFPSLKTLPFSWELTSGFGVKIFEMPSRDPSVIVNIEAAQERLKVGQRVYINWPNLQEAVISSIRPPDSTPIWTKILPKVVETYTRLGVNLGKVEAQIGVRSLQGLKREEDGSFIKDFDSQEIFYPAQLIVHHVSNEDVRFKERKAVPLEEQFPVDSNVLLLLAKYYGSPAIIKGYGKNNVEVEAIVPKYRDPVFAFVYNVLGRERSQSRWFTLDQVSRSIELPVKQLLLLTSRLMVTVDNKANNVALPLRKHGLGLLADGYSRMGYRQTWEFSERGVALIVAYLSRFRGPLVSILKGSSNVDSNVVKDMRDWLKKHTESIIFLPTTTERLSAQSVRLLEEKLSTLNPTHLEKVLIKGVERGALLAPSDAEHQLRLQRFKLGDRVVSAFDHGKVPLYSRGIVVGLNNDSTGGNTTLDVLWDHEMASASTLDGRTQTNRGLSVPASSVLNLTKSQLEYNRGKAPVVTRISAKVDMKSISAKPQQQDTNQQRFVPAPPRNDWNHGSALNRTRGPKHLNEGAAAVPAYGNAPPANMMMPQPAFAVLPPQAYAQQHQPAQSGSEKQASQQTPEGPKDEVVRAPKANPKAGAKKTKGSKGEAHASGSGAKASPPPAGASRNKSKRNKRGPNSPATTVASTEDTPKPTASEPTTKAENPGQEHASRVAGPEVTMPELKPKSHDPDTARKLLSKLFSPS